MAKKAPAPEKTVRLSETTGFIRIIASQTLAAGASEYLCVIAGVRTRVIAG